MIKLQQIIKYWSYGIGATIIGYLFTGLTGWSKSGAVTPKGIDGITYEFLSQPLQFVASFLIIGTFFGFIFWFGFKRGSKK